MRDLNPVFTVTTGVRKERPGERYIFFDKPSDGPTKVYRAELERGPFRVTNADGRASITLGKLVAGPFTGELIVRLYAGSPLLHFEAALTATQPRMAYVYDFVLEGDFPTVAWMTPEGAWTREKPAAESRPVAVKYRAIFAEGASGTLAVFPPPHAFFYPRDYSINFKFAQAGGGRFGLRQDTAGGPGHQGAFIPWFDAPERKTQRMSAFVLLSGNAEGAMKRVLRYTRGDRFKPMNGHLTMTSHWHVRLAASDMAGKPNAPEVVRVFKEMGVNIVHLAEFHGDGNPADPGPKRLPEMKAMFDVCRKYSDAELLLIPGEEANAHLNKPPPKDQHSGHWVYLFPRPVYLTLVRGEGVPFVEEIAPYGKVYHTGNEADMIEVLKREKGLAWTAHPRIKASFGTPDAYRHTDWYQDPLWFGAAWKAMPGDLSEPRLGVRVLDLLDDMNSWGQRKGVLGEVDIFEINRTHELWGNMNVNYVKLGRLPPVDDWTELLDALRRGDFFVTTGEVLVHAFNIKEGKAEVDLEWTFPLGQVELVSGDGARATRRTVPMLDAAEFGRRRFSWPVEPGAKWIRLEAWDIAYNGAFTQPVNVKP